eukprot:TRINITY_DN13609_c0_g1_i1.p1 TRINITY_DN13609_c0_g1~~TRINITY_DN13609_c0_g1_i1.p1  ORF type:complete len:321 (-),score=42.38 TRINITY_DN13609_c0_g1_i1:81-938(-)
MELNFLLNKRERTSLEPYRINFKGGDVFYWPNFVSTEEEKNLLKCIYDGSATSKWISLTKRRLKTMGGIPSMLGTKKEPLPAWAEEFITAMIDAGLNFPERPNHILLNEYSGGMGIAPHFDTDLYQPYVAVLNIQRPAMFHFFDPKTKANGNEENSLLASCSIGHLYLEPRSLLIFAGYAFSAVKHGILSNQFDTIDPETLNLHLLSKEIESGQTWSRNGKLVDLSDTSASSAGGEDPKSYLPRLSLTIRALTKAIEAESLETESSRTDEKHRLAAFYKSVSETV